MLIVVGNQVPVNPLFEGLTSNGTAIPSQNGAIGVKVAAGGAVTLIVSVVDTPHSPASGVNVYVPPEILFTVVGNHVPEIPFEEGFGNIGAVVPEQNAAIGVNVATGAAVTVIGILAEAAHCPAVGVKV